MSAKNDYYALVTELEAIERANGGIYLTDECIDRENIDPALIDESSDDFWNAMHSAACLAAGMRAEELGLDINALIGRVIY